MEAESVLPYIILIGFSLLSFWKLHPVLFMITCAISMMTGLYSPDLISGNHVTTNIGITIGLSLVVYALVCYGFALRLLFWRSEE